MRTLDMRCYDNGGQTADRYTVIPPRWERKWRNPSGLWDAIAASENPFHPQGFGQHVTAAPGRHLGRKIEFNDLPVDVQAFARRAFDLHPAVELRPDDPRATVCGHCGRGWDDSVSTGWTPTPGGRCPFEYDHKH